MRKKIIGLVLFTMLLVPVVAMAQGYTGPSGNVYTVAEALKMRDDAYVTLVGKIDRHLGGEKYMFSDATGSITVDIDHKLWTNLSVSDKDTIEITGEIDKDWNSVEVDVDRITKK